MPKFIFCTGGVVSSVGKGVTAAAIGRVLKARSLRVAIQKLDPYLNVDPGTMSPYQHGEVFVTEDGAETDLDLGHYERFIDENLTRACNVTTGQVYNEVISKERRGDYLGKTIQVVPHVTNEIKRRISLVAKSSTADVVIVEVGGTVGDIEAMPFIEAIRQMRRDVGRDSTFYVHVTFLPKVGATGELKTKPTQHSVRDLRGAGIQPDAIIARSDEPVDDALREKIALFCDVEPRAVLPMVTTNYLYEVPLMLEDMGFGDYLCERLQLSCPSADLSAWRAMCAEMRRPKPPLHIAIVGKYVELHDAYMSVREALYHAGVACGRDVQLVWLNSEALERGEGRDCLERVAGIVVPGGFGYRGIEGKIIAAQYARENAVPYLGLCLGMQVMCIEFARFVLNSREPNSTEFNHTTPYPVIDLMPDQRDISDMGGTMRLGVYPCQLVPGTRAHRAYVSALDKSELSSANPVNGMRGGSAVGAVVVHERHRHRFEFNNEFRKSLGAAGLVFSGLSPDGRLVEICELRDHPFMLGSQFHPEFKSRPNRPHPLFKAFIEAAIEYDRGAPLIKPMIVESPTQSAE
ncbi:MAG: CTP synthase [Chloroflexi bacterium]|jgi:CTP synthase|uniref:CTP synthase n=1 Tax=Candidatus Thermofonsia Clade 3 bacterium TaxID=2364212 RepID=A0A2M8QE12_9CHLR|nr:CTP synthase [Candidatus Roseilinea sp. NK_OTU-006]PJF47992.1 MAG: CTP synthase [Candidatus Thermofonsia Clade 3 bacterium]RMG62629.1 MAG: CTP synthase [Chloroflexota bacterium]